MAKYKCGYNYAKKMVRHGGSGCLTLAVSIVSVIGLIIVGLICIL